MFQKPHLYQFSHLKLPFTLQKDLTDDQEFLFLDHQLDLFGKLCYVCAITFDLVTYFVLIHIELLLFRC